MDDSGADPTRFVILNAPRTGSNYLCTLLNSHPDILCHHELFNPHVVGVARDFDQGRAIGTLEERERDPERFLSRAWSVSAGHRFVGFKLCWRQHPWALRAVLEDVRVRKIVLKRRNKIKSFVSLVLARQTGEWIVYHDSPPPGPRPKVRIDVADLFETIAYNNEYYGEIERTLAATRQSFLELHYEELLARETETLLATLEFLGVTDRSVSEMRGQSWKLTPVSLSETVANFEDLAMALKDTPLEPDLHSVSI